MRYGTKGGSSVVDLVEDDIHHHDAANIGSASNSHVVAALAGNENRAGSTIVCESLEFMFTKKYSRLP
jgi:hypothetical protein